MRKLSTLILILFVSILGQTNHTVAQIESDQCEAFDDLPSGCRQYFAEGLPVIGSPFFYQFSAGVTPSDSFATTYFGGIVDGLRDSSDFTVVQKPQIFGDVQVALRGTFVSDGASFETGIVAFRLEHRVAIWAVSGQGIDPFVALRDVYVSCQGRTIDGDDALSQVLQMLPDSEDLPQNFRLEAEHFSDDVGEPLPTATQEETRQEPTRRELEATIAALEAQVSELERANGETRAEPTVSSSSGSLEILDITTEDAGIGNGSLYAYVEVVNETSRLYPYVGLDGTCRDSSDQIVGTGFGNTTNVGPRETVVITMIFLEASGCTDVQVRFDSLTNLQ